MISRAYSAYGYNSPSTYRSVYDIDFEDEIRDYMRDISPKTWLNRINCLGPSSPSPAGGTAQNAGASYAYQDLEYEEVEEYDDQPYYGQLEDAARANQTSYFTGNLDGQDTYDNCDGWCFNFNPEYSVLKS